MAKKRKEKTDEEEIDFKLSKFDEKKFLKREKRNIKTLFLSFFFGLLIAFISFGFWSLLSGSAFRWELILLLGVFNISWLKYLFLRLNIDLTDFGRKGWFGSFATYFFTWLIVLIILVNPPFYDDEDPRVELVVLPEMQELGGTVKIVAKIIDNAGIEKQDIDFSLTYPDGTTDEINSSKFEFEDHILTYTYENIDNLTGEFSFKIIATDANEHSTEKEDTFTYSNDTIKLPEPLGADVSPGPEVTYTSTLKFDVGADVSRIYYTIDDGKEINATHEGDYYQSSPKQVGWMRDRNVTVKVYADIIYYFKNSEQQFNNTIVDTTTYYFNVSDVPEIGVEESPKIKLPRPHFEQVPGFETLVFIISLIVVVLIFKYRRKDRRN